MFFHLLYHAAFPQSSPHGVIGTVSVGVGLGEGSGEDDLYGLNKKKARTTMTITTTVITADLFIWIIF